MYSIPCTLRLSANITEPLEDMLDSMNSDNDIHKGRGSRSYHKAIPIKLIVSRFRGGYHAGGRIINYYYEYSL